jgi:ketosteroid isomerase-like protein
LNDHEALIHKLYTAFQKSDGATMAECYHPQATFTDPAFVNLQGAEVGAMWKMLTSRAKDFSMKYSQVEANTDTGSAYWEANYIFSSTGRKVLNKIHSSFRFKDGKIIEQRDNFNFWRWSRQALGPSGLLLGWTPFLQKKVQATAKKGLLEYMSKSKA